MYAEKIVFPKDMDYSPRYHQSKTSPFIAESLHNFADPERHPLRKSATLSTIYKLRLQNFPGIQRTALQTTKFVRVLTGHMIINSVVAIRISEISFSPLHLKGNNDLFDGHRISPPVSFAPHPTPPRRGEAVKKLCKKVLT